MLLKACLYGSRRRDEHRALPATPDEVAQDAARAAAAGAGAVHPKADGADMLGRRACQRVVAAVRAAVPGLQVGVTTGAGTLLAQGFAPAGTGPSRAFGLDSFPTRRRQRS